MECHDPGLLRAYLDDALPPAVRAEVAAHLAHCTPCRESLSTLRTSAAQVSALLGPPATLADPAAAFARLRGRIDPQSLPTPRRTTMQAQRWLPARRSWLGTVGAALAIISLLIFPPIRAAADELLQVFRVREVVFFPVDPARLSQLEDLDEALPTLFASEPTVVNDPAPPRDVESVDEATRAVGFPVRAPSALPEAPAERRITVRDRAVLSMQVDVDALRQLLAVAGIDDVALPDALGDEPITVDVRPWAAQRYAGQGWSVELYQGHSPDVTLPDGVDLATLGRTGLRVLGMSEAEAETVSRRIDWTSTLVVPIPPQVQDVRSVTVNNHDGLLVGASEEGGQSWLLYWQEGDLFYILEADGAISDAQVLAAANSLR
jgi:anti-sigma factor RsiW